MYLVVSVLSMIVVALVCFDQAMEYLFTLYERLRGL